ncbi:MAG: cardiolipin synthase [Desulfonatronovibrio sp.]
MEWHFVENWPSYLGFLFFLYLLTVMVLLINEQRNPTKTLTWLVVLIVFPFLGLVLYFFLGRNWKKIAEEKELHDHWRRLADTRIPQIRQSYAEDSKAARSWAEERGWEGLVDLIEHAEGVVPLPARDVQIFTGGAQKFARLKKDLSKAVHTINIQYFIWEHDVLTAELTAILHERIAAGVEVRILNDFIGNLFYPKDELKSLSRAGARVYFDVRQINKANYRNHRKIVVIDGVLGYTGGINVGQEYIDGGSRYPAWRDTHVCFKGPAVAELQKLFALRWYDATKENLFSKRFFPDNYPADDLCVPALVVATSVEDKWETARRAHVLAISRARHRVWIQSPYFVPDDQIYEVIINAALAGVDVRLIMTGWPDKKSAWYAAQTYFKSFLRAGGRIFFYTRGFFHAKTITIDSTLLAIGTMNMDVRSLELHKELMVWFLDESLAREHETVFEEDLLECEEYTMERLDSLSWFSRFRNSALRLASNLL